MDVVSTAGVSLSDTMPAHPGWVLRAETSKVRAQALHHGFLSSSRSQRKGASEAKCWAKARLLLYGLI